MLFLSVLTLLVLAALGLSIAATVNSANNGALPSGELFVGNSSNRAQATTVTTTTGMVLPSAAKWQLDTAQDLRTTASPTFNNLNVASTTSSAGQLQINGTAVLQTFGTDNIMLGAGAGNFSLTGHDNVAIGAGAGTTLASGNNNVAIGTGSLSAGGVTGADNIAVGRAALAKVTSGASNVSVGAASSTELATGINNCACGLNALGSATAANFSTAIGANALFANTADNNTAVGSAALFANTTGTNNVAVGAGALLNLAGAGNSNVALGQGAGTAYTTTESTNIVIGNAGTIGDSTTTRIGTEGTQTKCFIAGIRGKTTVNNNAIAVLIDSAGQMGTVSSSRRFKDMIQAMPSELSAKVYDLMPVTFHFKSDENKSEQVGLIAEDVEAVLPNLVARDEKNEPVSVRYHDLPVLLLNEMKKMNAEMLGMKARLAALETAQPETAQPETAQPETAQPSSSSSSSSSSSTPAD